MKATKKIVGAAAALVAAVALSAGSTFAWFSANSKIEVTGMKVSAVVPDALFIASGVVSSVSTINSTSLAITGDAKSLEPARLYTDENGTSTATLKRGTIDSVPVQKVATWTTAPTGTSAGTPATMQTLGTYGLSSDTITQDTTNTTPDVSGYVALYTMTVARINDSTDADLKAKVTITYNGTESDGDYTWKFIRTAFYTTNGWVSLANSESTISENELTFDYSGDNAVIDGDFDGNTAYVIQFAVFLDGDDTDCYANNAMSVSEFEIQIEYTATDGTTSTGTEGNT